MDDRRRKIYAAHLASLPGYSFVKLRIRELTKAGQVPGAGIVHVRLPPRYEHVPLFHRRTKEWLMILKGTGRGKIGGRVIRFRPGVVVYMPPGTVHQMSTGSSPLEALAVFSPPMDVRKRGADVHYPKR